MSHIDRSKSPFTADQLAQSWQALLIAVQLLTRIPVPNVNATNEAVYGRSVLFYPLVGLLIGLVLVFAAGLLSLLWPTAYLIQAGLILAVWCLITGGLHIDGLADSADAWMGGFGDRQRTLDLFKDPTCGPTAVMVVVVVLLIKFAALVAILETSPALLLWAPILARGGVLALFLTTPYAREGGLGAVLHQHLRKDVGQWVLLAVALLVLFLCNNSIWVLGFSVLGFYGLRWLMLQRLGGTTGDTAGALVELLEMGVLLALVI